VTEVAFPLSISNLDLGLRAKACRTIKWREEPERENGASKAIC
jgi:hypothetical protein